MKLILESVAWVFFIFSFLVMRFSEEISKNSLRTNREVMVIAIFLVLAAIFSIVVSIKEKE